MEVLRRQSRFSLIAVSLVSIVLLGIVDHLTGPEISFSIFYLLPISVVAWFVGRKAGIGMSVAGAATWLVADLLSGQTYSHAVIPYWNAIVRLGLFLIVSQALSGLRASRERQEELSQFIVHDLRSPLGNVMTGLQLLQEMADETRDSTQVDLVQMCLVSCNRMLTLVNSLLDLARLEGGRMPLQRSDVDVQELVAAALNQVSVWAGRKKVTLESDLMSGVQTVYTDAELTTRVLVNLLSNSIKFSAPESVVTVRVESAEPETFTFSVIDQGPGIPKEWADRIFDKFVQVEALRAGSGAIGSGLGLTFSRLAVELLGGRIWLVSKEDSGTAIAFTLPVTAQAPRT